MDLKLAQVSMDQPPPRIAYVINVDPAATKSATSILCTTFAIFYTACSATLGASKKAISSPDFRDPVEETGSWPKSSRMQSQVLFHFHIGLSSSETIRGDTLLVHVIKSLALKRRVGVVTCRVYITASGSSPMFKAAMPVGAVNATQPFNNCPSLTTKARISKLWHLPVPPCWPSTCMSIRSGEHVGARWPLRC